MISFLVLFVHFYIQTYCRKPKKGGNQNVPKAINELEENEKNELWMERQIQNSAFSDDDEDQDPDHECHRGPRREKDVEGAKTRQEKLQLTSSLLPQTLNQITTTSVIKDDEEFMGSGGDFDIVQWEALEESDVEISTDDSDSDAIPPLEEDENEGEKESS